MQSDSIFVSILLAAALRTMWTGEHWKQGVTERTTADL
jgi:hypothetical protein